MTAPDPATWFKNQLVTDVLIKANLTDYIQQALDAVAQTGYTSLTGFASGITANSFGYTPAWQIIEGGTRVRMRGGLQKTSFASGTTTIIAALPTAITPVAQVNLPIAMSNGTTLSTGRIDISSTGVMSLTTPESAHTWISLDNIEYDLS